MFDLGDIRLEMLQAGNIRMTRAWTHHKTVPYIIFAQSFPGRYELSAGDRRESLAPGDAFFTPPDLPLSIRHHPDPATGEMRIRYLHFNVTLWNSIALSSMFEFPLRVERAFAERLAAPIDELSALRQHTDFAATVRKNRLGFACLELLLPLLRPRSNMAEFTRHSHRIVPVLDYIRRRLDRKLTMTEVVAHSGMSRSALYQLFRRTMNLSPYQYLSRQRLVRAAEKLRNSDLTLGEIAETLGYPNQFLLSRHFKENYGISPCRYRRTQAWKFD